MSRILTALDTCERVLDALRRYERRDAAIDALVDDIIEARSELLTQLYAGAADARTGPERPSRRPSTGAKPR